MDLTVSAQMNTKTVAFAENGTGVYVWSVTTEDFGPTGELSLVMDAESVKAMIDGAPPPGVSMRDYIKMSALAYKEKHPEAVTWTPKNMTVKVVEAAPAADPAP